MAGRLLSPAEAAEHLGVKLETLAQWRWRKVGPPFRKVGKRAVRYSLDELEQWTKDGAR